MIRILADRDACISAGMCVLTAPEVFDQDDADGRVVVTAPAPATEELQRAAREAVGLCPARALSLDGETART
ncbi:ferredoxin [Nocardiopsis sediminis]|uniref:Ferredoxin n=1 Tax=Nocardiopsis sediminis TaxID=1778267 RepID=A0ABV8FQQ8_9ACTN